MKIALWTKSLVAVTSLLALMVFATAPPAEGNPASRHWIELGPAAEGVGPEVEITQSDLSFLTMEIGISGLYAMESRIAGNAFGLLDLPGEGRTVTLGAPDLPVVRRLVEIPHGAAVRAEVIESSFLILSLGEMGLAGRMVPVQEPLVKIPGASRTFRLDQARYETPGFAPVRPVEITGTSMIRSRRLAQIELRPVSYDPVLGKVRVITHMEIRLLFDGGDPAATARAIARTACRSFDAVVGPRVLNYNGYATQGVRAGRLSASEGLLVITPDSFVDELAGLTGWKSRKGFKVEVAPTSVTGTSLSEIKSYIQAAYESWTEPPLSYVLLAGDTGDIPSPTGDSDTRHSADLYYSTLSGSDYFPDVWLGRISVADEAQAAEVAARLLAYEKGEAGTAGWLKKATFIGTDDRSYFDVAEGTHNYCINNHMDPRGYASDKLYAITYGAGGSDVLAAVNDGRALVVYSGHGSSSGWSGPSFGQSQVRALTNGDMTPFVLSHACTTAPISQAECYGETWIREAAIGFWGASNSTYWDEDDVLQRRMFDALYDEALYTLGGMTVDALAELYVHYGGGGRTKYYFEVYHLLADPSMELWTGIPEALDVTYLPATPLGLETFDVTVASAGGPVEGALVCLVKEDEGIRAVGLTDASGELRITMDEAPLMVGALQVTVTAHDYLPHEGTSLVISPEGPYLVYSVHGIDDSAGNGDGAVNPGESVVMEVDLLNVGSETGSAIAAGLSTESEYASVDVAGAYFPDIAPWAYGTSEAPHFVWTADPASPDRTKVPFNLNWIADGGHSGTISFQAEICTEDDDDGWATCLGDCDDGDALINPDATEICDGVDNNCDGTVDEGFADSDGDGSADCVDCAILDPTVYPGASEACDAKDNDCDGSPGADEVDADGDGFMICDGDCDDTEAEVNPGAREIRKNGIDDDCDGLIDESCFTGVAMAE